TDDLAAGFCDQLVRSGERSRAIQMNAGARAAGCDVFWFLHADAEVPTGCLDEINRIIRDRRVSGGYFLVRFPRGVVFPLKDKFLLYLGVFFRVGWGGHGIFCRGRGVFSVGGVWYV